MRFRILFGAAALLTSLGAAAATGLVGAASAAPSTAYICTGGDFATGHFTSIPSGNYARITVKGVCNIKPHAVINVSGSIHVAAGAVLDAQSARSTITVAHNVTAASGSLLGMGCQPATTIGTQAGVPRAVHPRDTPQSPSAAASHARRREHRPAAQTDGRREHHAQGRGRRYPLVDQGQQRRPERHDPSGYGHLARPSVQHNQRQREAGPHHGD